MKRKARLSNVVVLLACVLAAPCIGIAVTKMIRDSVLGLDIAYFAFPTATLLAAAAACVTPMALALLYFRDEI